MVKLSKEIHQFGRISKRESSLVTNTCLVLLIVRLSPTLTKQYKFTYIFGEQYYVHLRIISIISDLSHNHNHVTRTIFQQELIVIFLLVV